MANPKALIYFSSVFAVAITPNATLPEQYSLLFLVFIKSLLWFAVMPIIFSMRKINQAYQNSLIGLTGLRVASLLVLDFY